MSTGTPACSATPKCPFLPEAVAESASLARTTAHGRRSTAHVEKVKAINA